MNNQIQMIKNVDIDQVEALAKDADKEVEAAKKCAAHEAWGNMTAADILEGAYPELEDLIQASLDQCVDNDGQDIEDIFQKAALAHIEYHMEKNWEEYLVSDEQRREDYALDVYGMERGAA